MRQYAIHEDRPPAGQKHAPEAYEYVLDSHKNELERARKVTLFTAAHGRDFIANAAIARETKCRGLSAIVDDMERTVDKLKQPEQELEPEIVSAGL